MLNFLEYLTEQGVITPDIVDAVTGDMNERGMSLDEALENRGVASDKILEQKAIFYEVPAKDVDEKSITRELLENIPQESAEHYNIVPIAITDDVLEVGTTNPDNLEARDALNFLTGKNSQPYKLYIISQHDLNEVLGLYNSLTGEVKQALSALEDDVEVDVDNDESSEAEMKVVEDAPVTKIVATIVRYATEGRASDIHIEHTQSGVRVRFRVDGELHTSLQLPKNVQSAVIARIKILASMRLDEKRKPQDGRFSAKIQGRRVDFRVSTFPTYYGEKVVMRILDQNKGVKKIDEIGLSENNLKLIKDALKRPHGLILVSGPTGSGKTTTLYSMLLELDREKNNVLSLEDPVEYNVEGISQSQMRSDIGYTFASGLRTALRQDPDIIMVGEIRDKETAQLAIQAALTGHLVLSTIHTNDAVGVVPRLVDMGVDPYLIAPTLRLAIAQRLVSKRCEGAGEEVKLEGAIKQLIDDELKDVPEQIRSQMQMPATVFKNAPGPDCPTGTRGRMAVTEVLEITKELESVILNEPTDIKITEAARAQGMLMLREDATLKVLRGEIPLEEISTL